MSSCPYIPNTKSNSLYADKPNIRASTLLGAITLLRRQRQILHTAEKANKILRTVSFGWYDGGSFALPDDLPKCNAEAPDRLHLKTSGLGGPNPVVVVEPVILIQAAPERGREIISGACEARGGANGLAVDVGKRLPNCDSHYRHSDEEHAVHASVDEEWKHAI